MKSSMINEALQLFLVGSVLIVNANAASMTERFLPHFMSSAPAPTVGELIDLYYINNHLMKKKSL